MTKQQLKEKYSEWNVKNGYECRKRNKEIFETLKELSQECGLSMWCSMNALLEQLLNTKHKDVALKLHQEYYINEGRQQALHDLALATKNFEI